MKRILLLIIFNIFFNNIKAQELKKEKRFSIGTSFFNVNESFDSIFIFNNSSPIIFGLDLQNFRIESTTNISLFTEGNQYTYVRGSLRLSFDYKKTIFDKINLYFGPQYGLNTNETHLINIHLGGEYFLHKNWSISNQVGLNFLFDNENQTFIQTNSSIILRFYINTSKK